jgi:hypothetical protein
MLCSALPVTPTTDFNEKDPWYFLPRVSFFARRLHHRRYIIYKIRHGINRLFHGLLGLGGIAVHGGNRAGNHAANSHGHAQTLHHIYRFLFHIRPPLLNCNAPCSISLHRAGTKSPRSFCLCPHILTEKNGKK